MVLCREFGIFRGLFFRFSSKELINEPFSPLSNIQLVISTLIIDLSNSNFIRLGVSIEFEAIKMNRILTVRGSKVIKVNMIGMDGISNRLLE